MHSATKKLHSATQNTQRSPLDIEGAPPYLDTLVITGGFFFAIIEPLSGFVKPFFAITGPDFLSEMRIYKKTPRMVQ